MNHSLIVANIVQRIGDIVNINHKKMFVSTELRTTHYFPGGFYIPHVDYQVKQPKSANQRYITFLMYLSDLDVQQGGNTSFTNAHDSCTDQNGYLGVQPIKGSAVFFYNLIPDGNIDKQSIHSGEMTVDSEKWVSNLGIWDPIYQHPIEWQDAERERLGTRRLSTQAPESRYSDL